MEFLYWLTRQFSFDGDMASMVNYITWYASLEKPFFAPPSWAFGLAWGIVYPLIGLALVWTLWLFLKKRIPMGFVWLFVLNMALNFSFTPVLIVTRDNTLISLMIMLVLGTLAWLMVFAWRFSKVIFWLLIPYLVWGTFATVLQLSITAMN